MGDITCKPSAIRPSQTCNPIFFTYTSSFCEKRQRSTWDPTSSGSGSGWIFGDFYRNWTSKWRKLARVSERASVPIVYALYQPCIGISLVGRSNPNFSRLGSAPKSAPKSLSRDSRHRMSNWWSNIQTNAIFCPHETLTRHHYPFQVIISLYIHMILIILGFFPNMSD